MTKVSYPQPSRQTDAEPFPTPSNRPWRRPSVNIGQPERAARIFIGLAAIIAGVVLLVAASSAPAVELEILLIAAGLDLAVTGAAGTGEAIRALIGL
jgi:hypothetical protein